MVIQYYISIFQFWLKFVKKKSTKSASKDFDIQPVLNRDYRVYKDDEDDSLVKLRSGIFVKEYLYHQYVIINIKKYTCEQETNRFKTVIYNVSTEEFTVEVVKTKHNPTNCFYCNIISKISASHKEKNTLLMFNTRYSQAILNFWKKKNNRNGGIR